MKSSMHCRRCVGVLSVAGVVMGIGISSASPWSRHRAPELQFTNLASLLLETQLGVTYGRLQVYPTNEYTPAVHRLLQVSANIHEAARPRVEIADDLPRVFKPVFERNGETIFIAGYEEVDDLGTAALGFPLDLSDPADRAALQPGDNVFGVPWIIGVRKGLPNFNELSVETVFELSRRLQVGKALLTEPPTFTNQAHLISVGSALGVEAWNPYRADFTNAIEILVTNRMEITLALTNQPSDLGSLTPLRIERGWRVELTNWTGTGSNATPAPESFVVFADTNLMALADAIFRADGRLEPATTNRFLAADRNQFPTPEIWLSVSNELQFVMMDRASGRVIDYVHLRTGTETNLTVELDRMSDRLRYGWFRNVWNTQRPAGGVNSNAPTIGALTQIAESMNPFNASSTGWRDAGVFGVFSSGGVRDQIYGFIAFMVGFDRSNAVVSVPFTPTARFRLQGRWEANDPLVHYTIHDLAIGERPEALEWLPMSISGIQPLRTVGRLNERYNPWGGNPQSTVGAGFEWTTRYNPALKDPLIRSADDWDFPSGRWLTPFEVGRIHRGTPWQTLYLKAEDAVDLGRSSSRSWREWTGIHDSHHAVEVRPSTDWTLVWTLMHELWPEEPQKLLSVNEPNGHHWLKALNGMVAFTNTTADAELSSNPWADPVIEPRIIGRTSDQASIIIASIEAQRQLEPGGFFADAGAILRTPALSSASPWLNLSDIQRQAGIPDEAYEAIPLQLLRKIRPDSIGSVTGCGNGHRLHFSGLNGSRYVIESSTDLIHWTPVATHHASRSGFWCDVFPPSGSSGCFYRSCLLTESPANHRPK